MITYFLIGVLAGAALVLLAVAAALYFMGLL